MPEQMKTFAETLPPMGFLEVRAGRWTLHQTVVMQGISTMARSPEDFVVAIFSTEDDDDSRTAELEVDSEHDACVLIEALLLTGAKI